MTTAEEVREASRQQDGTPREQIDRELYAKFQMEREIMASEPEPGERAASRDLDELIL